MQYTYHESGDLNCSAKESYLKPIIFLKVNGENGLCYLQAFLFLKMPFLGIFVYFKDVKLFITHIYSVEVQLYLIYFWCILFTDTFWRVVFKPF